MNKILHPMIGNILLNYKNVMAFTNGKGIGTFDDNSPCKPIPINGKFQN
jgi:hypothetical protein